MFLFEEVVKFGYNVFYYGQKGYYGVVLLIKEMLIVVCCGFFGDDEEVQWWIIMVEIFLLLGNVIVINGYFLQGESCDYLIKFLVKVQFYQNL